MMTCPTCGEEERQDRKTVLADARPVVCRGECLGGDAWQSRSRSSPARNRRPAIAIHA
jgi:hypothetical protein